MKAPAEWLLNQISCWPAQHHERPCHGFCTTSNPWNAGCRQISLIYTVLPSTCEQLCTLATAAWRLQLNGCGSRSAVDLQGITWKLVMAPVQCGVSLWRLLPHQLLICSALPPTYAQSCGIAIAKWLQACKCKVCCSSICNQVCNLQLQSLLHCSANQQLIWQQPR